MKNIALHPIDLERDFGQLAELFTAEQNEPTTEAGLRSDYEAYKERIIRLMVEDDLVVWMDLVFGFIAFLGFWFAPSNRSMGRFPLSRPFNHLNL